MSINDHFTIGETSDLLGITEREVVKYFGIEKRDGRVQREISIPEIERYCRRFRRRVPKNIYQARDQLRLDLVDPKPYIRRIYDILNQK